MSPLINVRALLHPDLGRAVLRLVHLAAEVLAADGALVIVTPRWVDRHLTVRAPRHRSVRHATLD